VARGLAAALAAASVLFPSGGPGRQTPLSGWLAYGNGGGRPNFTVSGLSPAKLRAWHVRLDGAVLTQPLVVRDTPEIGQATVYVGTSGGSLYALSAGGRIRWRAELGRTDHECRQLPEYGITGTPALDSRTRAIYAVDALGRLHALDLLTGRERPGWPVTLYQDYRKEMVWGAILGLRGLLFVGTASYCDLGPMEGKLFRVSLAKRRVRSWAPVPARLGGGGGIWGWGGLGYSTARQSLFVAPGNALSETSQAAGYGEHLVELTTALRVRAANHPRSVAATGDVDFGGSPTLLSAAGCGRLVLLPSKNGRVYAWRESGVGDGPAWTVDLRRLKPRYPLVTQLAVSPRLRSIFVATGTRLVRISLGEGCRPRIAWALRVPRWAYNGSPTVAGNTVWLGTTKRKRLLAVDARSGRVRASLALDGPALAAPAVVDGRLYVGTTAGGMYGIRAG
jgi:outer membrane protein assembly factor BamB